MEEIVMNDVIINECWRSIDGYLNYQVSNIGRIRNANNGNILKPLLVGGGYHQICLYNSDAGVRHYIHKLVAQEFLEPPDDTTVYRVDHVNRDRTDNQVTNLRYVTDSQNSMNRSKITSRTTSSVYKGVYLDKSKNKWKAQIQYNKTKINLGLFSDEAAAARAYDLKAQELFGEYAVLNFPVD